MTLTGLVPRMHGVRGFNNADFYVGAPGVGAGSALGFTRFVLVRVGSYDLMDAGGFFLFSNCDAAFATGWFESREFLVITDARYSIANLGMAPTNFALNAMAGVDRFMLLGQSFEPAVAVTPYMNGAPANTLAPTFIPSTGRLGIGGSLADPTLGPTRDWIIGAGYDESVYTADDFAELFRFIRQTGRLTHPTLPMSLRYETLDLEPREGSLAAPATWPNTGSLGAAGDLAWNGAPGALVDFETDASPVPVGTFTFV